jgi:hypothetical protein
VSRNSSFGGLLLVLIGILIDLKFF